MSTNLAPKKISKTRLRQLLGIKKGKKLPTVSIIANIRDEATQCVFVEIAFSDEDSNWRSIQVPLEDLRHRPAQIRDLLSRYGAALPHDPAQVKAIMKGLAVADAPNRWIAAKSPGWSSDGTAFVLNDRVVGAQEAGRSSDAPELTPPLTRQGSAFHSVKRSGELKAWKDQIASQAEWSASIALALSCAFAAPLLRVFDWPTFMIVLHGEGKAGKSTAALAGATVIGIGSESDLPNWNVKDAALLELASGFNDLLLVLNGLESSKAKDKELRNFLQNATYILGDGIDTRRHSSWSGRQDGALATWRTIVLATSEHSFDEIAARANDQRLAGERARAINVPAKISSRPTIIDRFPKDAPADAAGRLAWARSRLEGIRAASAKNHGVVLHTYLRRLVRKDRQALRGEILAARDEFVASVKASLGTEALHHAAKNMGIVYAGGVQAIDAGFLPLTKRQLRSRIGACFDRSMREVQGIDPVRVALTKLRAGLHASIGPNDKPCKPDYMAIERGEGGASFVAHVSGLFNGWFDGDRRLISAALRWLCEQDLLDVDDRAAAERSDFSIASVRHIRRIKGRGCATVVFRDPRPQLATVLALFGAAVAT